MSEEIKSESAKKNEDWMNTKWRPAMGWMYMVVCIFDFILFPVLWAVIQFWETQAANDAFRQWNPLTLQGAGLFHMAMGAVLGIAAWSRGQEKIAGAASGPPSLPGLPTPSIPSAPAPMQPTVSAPKPVAVQPVINSPAPAVTAGYGGKKAPMQEEDPLI